MLSRTRIRPGVRLLAAVAMTFGAAHARAAAQVVTDPRTVQFTASPDHYGMTPDNQPLVTGYQMAWYPVGATSPSLIIDLGKPAPDSTGTITLDLGSYLTTSPTSNVTYNATVIAVGPTGSSSSPLSNPFIFSGACSAVVSPTAANVPASGGTGTLNVTAPGGCSWTATSSVSWITLAAMSGGGSQAVAYSVAPNTSSSSRTGAISVAGSTVTITQAAVALLVALPGDVQAACDHSVVSLPASDNGTFSFSNGCENYSALALDLNGDKYDDVFVYDKTSGTWLEGFNDQAGGFTYASGAWWPGWDLYALDLNRDGYADVLAYNKVTGIWVKCLNGGNGVFSYQSGVWWAGWQFYPMDLNGDGATDLFGYNPTTGMWVKVFIDAKGNFSYASGQWWAGWDVYPIDLDRDGLMDLFVYNRTTGQWVKVFNSVSGLFSYQSGAWWAGWKLYPMDLNGDGKLDLFAYDPAVGTWVKVFIDNRGGFSYASGQWWAGWDLYPIDLNGDGLTDLLVYNPTTGNWAKAFNDGGAGFSYTTGQWPTGLVFLSMDLNGDGKRDVEIYNRSANAFVPLIAP